MQYCPEYNLFFNVLGQCVKNTYEYIRICAFSSYGKTHKKLVFLLERNGQLGRGQKGNFSLHILYTFCSMHMFKSKLLKRERGVLHDRLPLTSSNAFPVLGSRVSSLSCQSSPSAPSCPLPCWEHQFALFPPLCSDYACEVTISSPLFPKTFSGILRLS